MKINLFGSLPPPIGGTTVALSELIYAMESKGLELEVTNLSNFKSMRKIPLLLINIIKVVRNTDIVTIHVAINKLLYFGTLLRVLCFMFRKPYIVRRFGGICISELPWYKRIFLTYVYRGASTVLCETKGQLKEARKMSKTALWFPNARHSLPDVKIKDNMLKKFVYISQIKKDKGVFELLNCFKKLSAMNSGIVLEYYGPLFDGIKESDLVSDFSSYCGVLEPDKVSNVLIDADVLVLPTYYSGEGYPGIIIESLMTATPVITTQWKAIPEIVDSSCSLLVEPQNLNDLFEKMQMLIRESKHLNKLRFGAHQMSKKYTIESQANCFLNACRNSVENG